MKIAATVVAATGMAIFVISLAAFYFRNRSDRITPQLSVNAGGTVVRPDRVSDSLIRTSLTGAVLAMALIAVLQPLGALAIPVPHSMRYAIPVTAAIGALGGLPLVIRAFARGSMSYLRLTRKGFEFAEGRHPERGRWDSVQDIADRAPDRPAPKGPSIVMVMRDGATPTIAVGAYSPEGSAVRRMVQFYWKHPDHRDELMDGRAVQRLRDDDFGQARRKLG